MTEKTVTIPEKEYHKLLDDQLFLEALRAAGVDNWDGWDFAIEILQEWSGEEKDDV